MNTLINGIEKIKEYRSGTCWCKLQSKEEIDREGEVMNHCDGSYYDYVKLNKFSILSLRDPNNIPRCTVEYKNKKIFNIRGNSEGIIDKKFNIYINVVLSGKAVSVKRIHHFETITVGIIKNIDENYCEIAKFKNNIIVKKLNLCALDLTKLPDLSKVIVKGTFSCSNNTRLTSLKGSPQVVEGDYNCAYCNITSLEGMPSIIKGSFYCSGNKITSLKYGPKEVGENYNCNHNKLTTLEGAPNKINDLFICNNNNLISLKGAPKTARIFECDLNTKKFTIEEVKEVCDVTKRIKV